MGKKAAAIIFSLLLCSPVFSGIEDLRGEDWVRMSLAEKQRFVYTGIGGLERQGVFITQPPQHYIETLDKLLGHEAGMRTEFLDNLFVFCVHESEPQTRSAIEKIKGENSDGTPL